MITHASQNKIRASGASGFFLQKKEVNKGGVSEKSIPAFSRSDLTMGSRDDVYEKEADAMADKVMRMSMPALVSFSSSNHIISRKCAECEEEEKKQLQRKEGGNNSFSVAPSIVHDVLNSSGGRSLDADTRSFMEPRFNCDFSNIKIHDNEFAAKSAASINALAYTSGNNIVFNSGQYSPGSDSGKRLLAHELTHVVQQNTFLEQSNAKNYSSLKTKKVDLIQKADKKKDTPINTAQLVEFAKWPEQAKVVWKKLSSTEQNLVLLQMAAIYGSDFAKQFLEQLESVKQSDLVDYYFGKGVGPKPEQLIKRGFRLAQKDSVHEWWVHPSGISITRNYTEDKVQKGSPAIKEESRQKEESRPAKQPITPEKPQKISLPECKEIDNLTKSICEAADSICRIASQLNDEWSRKKCETAMESCKQANQRSTQCNNESLPNS